MVTLRGFARYPKIETMQEVYGVRPVAIAVYPMYKGLARLVGMDIADAGATLPLAHERLTVTAPLPAGATSYVLLTVKPQPEGVVFWFMPVIGTHWKVVLLNVPVVTVRIGELRGDGPYRGQLFVTGRTRTGGRAGSAGEVSLDLRGEGSTLRGSFEGSYRGEAGKGSVQGRFRGCSHPLRNAAPPQAVSSSVAR